MSENYVLVMACLGASFGCITFIRTCILQDQVNKIERAFEEKQREENHAE